MKFFLFLHGFQGSPHSDIITELKKTILSYQNNSEIEFSAPDIAGLPIKNVIKKIIEETKQHINDEKIFIGCSLGGFFALQMFKKYSGKLILINPCLNPSKYIDKHINKTYTHHSKNREMTITLETKKQLIQLENNIQPIENQENILLLTQDDDEIINFQDAINMLPQAKTIIKSGGGHHFFNFSSVIPEIMGFCNLQNQN